MSSLVLNVMMLPKEFNLYNHTIKVRCNPSPLPIDRHGDADYSTLYTHDACAEVVAHTFYHELTHFLLHYAGRDDLSEDETLVDTIGGLLAQYDQTKR